MKPKQLSLNTFNDLLRHTWCMICQKEGINYEPQQVQLCTEITNLLAPYGIDVTTHRHWTVPKDNNHVDIFLSFWNPGDTKEAVASKLIDFSDVADNGSSRLNLYMQFRQFLLQLQLKLFPGSLSNLMNTNDLLIDFA